MRYTEKDAIKATKRLMGVLNKHQATNYKDVGGWNLDYNPTYGGCVIEEVVNEHGAITHPLGALRRSPREFCDAVDFALNVINEDRRQQ